MKSKATSICQMWLHSSPTFHPWRRGGAGKRLWPTWRTPVSYLPSFSFSLVTRPFRYDLNQIPYDYTEEVRNRFKGLDLIDRVPDKLQTEVRDIVQETGIKTNPQEKEMQKKAKWLSEEALQIAVKRREAKSKGEKEKYTHLKAEFQRIAGEIRKPSSMINAKK